MSKPIRNNSQLLYQQARQLFEQAHAKFEDGSIKSEPMLVSAVFNSFQEFFTSMGKPNLKPRYAPEDGPPWSEDYNSMMNEVRMDLELLYQEVDILGRSLYTDFNHNMIQQEILQKQFESVLEKMRDLELYEGLTLDNRLAFGRDDFLNKSKIDYSRISGTPLEIEDGGVTLPQTSRQNVAENAQITIITGNRKKDQFIIGTESNGFPGNNTEIHSVTDDVLTNKNYIPTFLGENNNHGDYSVVLDGTPNTWFEYEKVNVRDHDKMSVAKNIGWDYQVHENQTISWAEDPENGVLKLHMQMILDKEAVINQINCSMYTPPGQGAKAAIVKNVLVSDGKSAPRSVLPKNKKDDQYSFHFPPIKAKVISIIFEQPNKYLTEIGHIFFEKKMQAEDDAEYAMDMATKKYKYAPRVEGPLISLEDLGIKVNVSEKTVNAMYPLVSSSGELAASIGESINRLSTAADMDTVDMGVEKFEGFRWAIGIRDIEVFSCEYAEEGELVTTPFYFDKALDKISLDMNEDIPTILSSNPALKYDWMKYFISIDDGATWNPITPMAHEVLSADQPPKIYTVRTVEDSSQILNNKQDYLESEYPVHSLRLKIIARRPKDYTTESFMLKDGSDTEPESLFAQTSPIVSGYTFNVSTMNDIADSAESNFEGVGLEGVGGGAGIDTGAEPPPAYEGPPIGGGDIFVPLPGGPDDDDNGDGVPNRNDPEWKPQLTVVLTNQKTQWCTDEDLLVKAQIYSQNPLVKSELYLNGVLYDGKVLSGNIQNVEYVIAADHLVLGTATVGIKGYDSKGEIISNDVMNIIDCTGLPEEDRPKEKDTHGLLSIQIDSKPISLCECEQLIFYGVVEGPNQIQSITYSVNGFSIDPNDLGTPPENDPCGNAPLQTVTDEETLTFQKMNEDELLKIESFGEWLEAFEAQEDCGCRNKRQQEAAPQFTMQATPFSTQQVNEQSFQVIIPYWKLVELNTQIESQVTVTITAIDSIFEEVSSTFTVEVKNCEQPPTDEFGNPRERDCLQLESIEIHYYDFLLQTVTSKVIPQSTLPYEGISNGAGSSITVGWDTEGQAPIIMQTGGYDESGSSFQIHAVGIHYLDEYDQMKTTWTETIGMTGGSVNNTQKMIGSPTRNSLWTEDMENGNYLTAPALGGLNSFVTFVMKNEWISDSCTLNIPNFEPSQYEKPLDPEEDNTEKEVINDCNRVTHIMMQVFNESERTLEILKIDITNTGKDTYYVTTSNGSIGLVIGWVGYFEAPAIQILSGAGSNNILVTAVGILYTDMYGEAMTHWGSNVRYKTNGTQYAEFAAGGLKTLNGLSWVQNGVVDFTQAPYIGKVGDMVAYSIDRSITDDLCPPEKTIDSAVGIDPNNPTDRPTIHFTNVPDMICIDDGILGIEAITNDQVGLKVIEYSILINDQPVYGPYAESIDGLSYNINYPVSTNSLQVGDSVAFTARVVNEFNVEAYLEVIVVAGNCDVEPPVIALSTTLSQTNGGYCYSDLIEGAAPIQIQVTDDQKIANWTVSTGEWTQGIDYAHSGEEVSDSGLLTYELPISGTVTVDEYDRSYLADNTVTIQAEATDRSGKQTTATLVLDMTDCSYDPTPPIPIAQAIGDITVNSSITYSGDRTIGMGDFMTQWTQWHSGPEGGWSTVSNAGRTELTNSVNQGGYSGWYNQNHLNEGDYYFEMMYQTRGGDDDMMGSFFRVQTDAAGFYSVEHDGGGSHVNGSGFRIVKHQDGVKTILAEDLVNGWTINEHRAYKIAVTLEGSKITVDLFGDSVYPRASGEAAPDPINWVSITTLTVDDSTYATGAWGPITFSQPETYFWNLRMLDVNILTTSEDSTLQKLLSISKKVEYAQADRGVYKDIQLTTTTISEEFATIIGEALARVGSDESKLIKVDYQISASTVKDVHENNVPLNQLKFVPADGATPQETKDPNSVIWGNVIID